jgi:hypothetical protein
MLRRHHHRPDPHVLVVQDIGHQVASPRRFVLDQDLHPLGTGLGEQDDLIACRSSRLCQRAMRSLKLGSVVHSGRPRIAQAREHFLGVGIDHDAVIGSAEKVDRNRRRGQPTGVGISPRPSSTSRDKLQRDLYVQHRHVDHLPDTRPLPLRASTPIAPKMPPPRSPSGAPIRTGVPFSSPV